MVGKEQQFNVSLKAGLLSTAQAHPSEQPTRRAVLTPSNPHSALNIVMDSRLLKPLSARFVTSEAFQPYGQLISPIEDGKPYSEDDAQLQLQPGRPRFYIMRLYNRGRQFNKITRHLQCTQCLGSLGGKEWLIAVAPPSAGMSPNPDEITAFQIAGDCFIKLAIGTWHAGPYFTDPWVDFYNLELSDTNSVDHDTCNLVKQYGTTFEIVSVAAEKAG